jgi:hypothetical protein
MVKSGLYTDVRSKIHLYTYKQFHILGQFNQRKPSATAFQNWANKKKLGSISPNRNHPFNMVNSQQNNMRN